MTLGTQKKLLVVALAAIMVVGCGGKEERKAKYLERGKAFIAEENWDKAGVEIKNVLQIDPKSAEAFYLMGQVQEKKQEWAKAFVNYSKAVELNPDLIDARSRLAQFYVMQASAYEGRSEREGAAKALGQAQSEIDEILTRDASHSGGRTLKATLLAGEGKYEEAIALVESVLKDDPQHEQAAILLSALYIQAKRPDDAENILVSAINKSDGSINLKLQLARLYADEKKNESVEKVLREIVSAKPDDLKYRIQLAQFLNKSGQTSKAMTVLQESVVAAPDDGQRYLLVADLMALNEDSAGAIEYLKKSIAQKPEIPDLRLGLATFFEKANQLDDAKKVYDEMVVHFGDEPPGLAARNHLAALSAAAGDFDDALKFIDHVLINNPKDNEALLLKGRIAMQQGDFETAVASFRAVLKDEPGSVTVLHLLADAQLRKGDLQLAGDNLQRAVELAPLNIDARIKYARYLIAIKDLPNALEQIDKALNQDSANADALAAKAEVLAAKGDLKAVKEELLKLKEAAPESPEAPVRLARVYFAEGNTKDALTEIESALKLNPQYLGALVLKSDILATTQDPGLEDVVQKIKDAAPDNPEGYFRSGRLLRAKGDIKGALNEYEKAYSLLGKDAGKAALLTEIVNTQLSAGQADAALARIESILSDDPQHMTAYDLLGFIQMSREDYPAAEAAFTKQLEINPNSLPVYAQLASAREQQGNLAGAVSILEQALSVNKDDIKTQMSLAGVYERQGNVEGAMELYEKVLVKQPNNVISTNNLAALLIDNRSDEKSLERAKELAVKLATVQNPAIQDTVGWVYYRTGDYSAAVKVLEGVANAEPKAAIFQYHLGMAYAKAGEKAKAKTTLTKALELAGDFVGADEARKVLDSL